EVVERFRANGIEISVKDFRRTILSDERLGARQQEECAPLTEYVLFDLGADSDLEAITAPGVEFRVTMYDPDRLKLTHAPRRHQYLIARDVIDADVVINVPKLKTHKKACLTGALKNLVGINGHKEYLPHHRKGSEAVGGDCYSDRSLIKRVVEDLMDAGNRAQGKFARRLLATAVVGMRGLGKVVGVDANYDGSWHGNDTVWRMCLDIQRVLHYGRADGTLAAEMQRRILNITDAIVAGEGEGPLSPTPVPFGVMTLGTSTAAVEWVHALLMGLDPARIPLTRGAFALHHPLTDFPPERIAVQMDGVRVPADQLFARHGRAFQLPRGWQPAVDRLRPIRAAAPAEGVS
ncbi:MAG TPA: DUF362 domain-containing protein, partial [Candidatus Polarisedimenticolia bacterium]|nr:DUF362 domain-containing protein [Candidatus Polarisedimenticolia bacterium]